MVDTPAGRASQRPSQGPSQGLGNRRPLSQPSLPAGSAQNAVDDDGDEVIPDSSVATGLHERNVAVQDELLSSFLRRSVNCRSVPQLVALVPAIVQEKTKELLDRIVDAHVKKAMAASLLADWRDSLAKESFGSIPQLKSLRAPTIQVSKIAELEKTIKKDFDDSLKEAKKSALTRMIDVKNQEVEILNNLCEKEANAVSLQAIWLTKSDHDGVSAEAYSLLTEKWCPISLVQTAISIGENTAQKQIDAKIRKSETVVNVKTKSTDSMPEKPQDLVAFVKEVAERHRQSVQDKSRAKKSGKGQRGAGPSKTKNQKKNTNKVGKKNRKTRKGKRGTSSKKQPKKP
jgi:hypothetical protein